MTQLEESLSNQSLASIAECEELRKKVALSSSDLIELTYQEEKFISKLEELNRIACQMIEEDKYQHASVYLNEAERILEYAAGCGKTIERTVITTILNNQATLLQRTSEFVQSSNYLEAIIYNISEFLEGCHPFESSSVLKNPQSQEYSQIATYFERKLALALYHLRFCALTSHNKTHEIALNSAKKAMTLLKEICKEEYELQKVLKDGYSSKNLTSAQSLLSETDSSGKRMILKEISNLKTITAASVEDFSLFLSKCLISMSSYNQRITGSQTTIQGHPSPFENYSIGSLMQASPQQLNLHPSPQDHMTQQLSLNGKLFKVVYLSMAHFTIATELRLLSANKYALDEDQRKSSEQFKESRINHLMSLILLARYLPTRSVFFQHALSSFRNHYGIDLIEMMDKKEEIEAAHHFSITQVESVQNLTKKSISEIEQVNTYEQYNQSIQIHENQIKKGQNLISPDHPTPKMVRALMKEIHNEKHQPKKLKVLKSKSKSKHITTSFSRMLESNKNLNLVVSKNKENKSKSKMLQSKGKETLRSRRKELKTENDQEDKRGIYYGMPSKSRSKSKRTIIERKNSKKGLLVKTGFNFENNKKNKHQPKIDQEYGIKSAGAFGDYSKPVKNRQSRNGHGQHHDEQNIYLQKHVSPKHSIEPLKMKKLKSPARTSRHEPSSKRKSLAKERHFQ